MKLLKISLVTLVGLAACQGAADQGDKSKVSLPATPPSATAIGTTAASAPAGTPEDADLGGVLTGTTAARRTSQVSASGSGLLTELKVREGDFVKAGQVIAQLDRRDARLRTQQAEAALKLARVQLTSAEREVARLERLEKDQAVPAADLDRVRTARDAAAAQVEVAEVNLGMARKADSDADVRAPFDGLVTARLKGEGEWISTMPPAPLVMLAEVQPLELRVDVPAALLAKVKVGDALTVRFAAVDRELTTRITRVLPQVMPQTRAFAVYAELPNEDRSLAPGLFAEVRLAGADPSARRDEGAPPRGGSPPRSGGGGAAQ